MGETGRSFAEVSEDRGGGRRSESLTAGQRAEVRRLRGLTQIGRGRRGSWVKFRGANLGLFVDEWIFGWDLGVGESGFLPLFDLV